MKLFIYAGFIVGTFIQLCSNVYSLTITEEETEFWTHAQKQLKTQQKAAAGAPPPPPPGSHTTVVNDDDKSENHKSKNESGCCVVS